MQLGEISPKENFSKIAILLDLDLSVVEYCALSYHFFPRTL